MRKAKLFACAVAMAMALSLCACGNKDEEKDTKTKTEESSKEDSSEESEDESSDKFESIEAYITEPTIKESLDAMIQSLEGSGMTLEIKADGNKLVYVYTYTEVVKSDDIVAALEAGLEEQADGFITAAASIKDSVDVENPVVEIQYVDANGELICSREFQAE